MIKIIAINELCNKDASALSSSMVNGKATTVIH